jgi:anti-anti-sigma regulatory factor
MERALRTLSENLEAYAVQSTKRVIDAQIKFYKDLPEPPLRASIQKVFEAVLEDARADSVVACPALLARIGEQRVKEGALVSDILAGMDIGYEVVTDHFNELYADDPEARLWWERMRRRLSYAAALALADSYVMAREAYILDQSARIRKLSVPLIPLYRGVLLLPLVGEVDRERGTQIVTSVLSAIAASQSSVVILDVTGVPTVDATVASGFLGVAGAARLMGTETVLVGINPAVAQTLAELGVEVRGVTVLADLASAVEHALRLQGKAIRP